jgi:hypothetical protein
MDVHSLDGHFKRFAPLRQTWRQRSPPLTIHPDRIVRGKRLHQKTPFSCYFVIRPVTKVCST